MAAGWQVRAGEMALRPLRALQEARGHLFPLAAVAIGAGVGVWFALPFEPGRPAYLAALGAALLGLATLVRAPEPARPLGGLALALALGFLAAGLRAHLQAAPMLDFRYHGPVEGRVIEIDRSSSDALRITLDRVVLREMAPDETPLRVRVSLQGEQGLHDPAPGETVIVTAHLAAPNGPVEPGSFDFRRMAYFERLGAVGYTRNPVLLLEPAAPGDEWIGRIRMTLSEAIRARIPGQAGAFAAGAMTGDRSAITQDTVAALRDSSLAHLLAISGMNLAFLAAFVFALVRTGIACVPPLALRVNAKKVAAVISFFVALFYMLLSGANVATERAFLMLTVVLGAVMLDRRAITLRAAAITAAILLLARPETLLDPGFQMSFAATVALVWGFQTLDHKVMLGRWPLWTLPVFTLVASSAIAGIATAPYAAAHFNRFTDYGFVANLLTVPVMGAAIMPMGALAALLAPFGLAGLPLWVMGLACEWVLIVAHRVAALDGAVTGIPTPGALALPLITLGALWLVLWPGRARLAGLAVVLAGLVAWPLADRPALLIAGDGRLAGLAGPEGRALSAPRGGGFAASNWLENDGDLVSQAEAAARPGFDGPKEARRFAVAGLAGVLLSGKAGLALLPRACAEADLVIVAERPEAAPPPGCGLIGPDLLAETGALALHVGRQGEVQLLAARAGGRLWDGAPMAPDTRRALEVLVRPAFAPGAEGGAVTAMTATAEP